MSPQKVIHVPAQEMTEADRRLDELFARMEVESITTLESHARQIVTLSTTLLAAFFGLLSLSNRPAFLALKGVQICAAVTLTAFLVALLFALDALLPRRYEVPAADLTAKREVLNRLLRRKETAVKRATYTFGAAAGLMLVTALIALWWG